MPGRDLSAELFGTTQPPAGGRDLTAELAAHPEAQKLGWGDVPGQALKNLLPSAGNFVGGIAQAVRHPLDTAGNLLDIGAGALRNSLPDGLVQAIDRLDPNPQAAKQASAKADAAGQFFKDRYGSAEGLKRTLATDPVGALSDASVVLGGIGGLARLGSKGLANGAALAGRTTPGLATALNGAADGLGMASTATNPVALAAKGVQQAAPVVGNAAAALVGNLGTHTGAESMKAAFDAGRRGGASAQALADNMRGNAPMADVLDTAKANLAEMARQKSAEYRQGMAAVSNDKTVLDFNGIDQAVKNAGKIGTYKGQTVNPKAAAVQQAIADTVDQWKALDPAEFHTPEGMDALKQKIGGILDELPYEQKSARLLAGNVYNAVKQEIVKQAPTYADTMKAYTESSDLIREIERALSLGQKSAADTALRKLQSLTRNNVNTNYGNRLNLARQLEQQGGRELMPALAGQALSSWTPRGLGGAVAGGLGMGGYALGGMGAAVPALALQSPRLMGEAALGAGRVAGGIERTARPALSLLDSIGIDPALTTNLLYQSGRLPQ